MAITTSLLTKQNLVSEL